ncbi:MAG TPA: COX15/CtaA family protein [Ferrovibrio sp.]|uniref:COX15/CtaA family protein n=1 Tax=Ferrovibrio sp. TaxID=1917215 RepID=UPI002ED0785D
MSTAATTMSIRPAAAEPARAMAYWLFAVAALVALMVVIGGLTRLTESGLSIVEWKPITGVIPPLNHAEWVAEFEKYKLFPEYQKINIGMTLEGFKSIFWLEYIHRLLGRLIGVVFALPMIWFWLRGRIPVGMKRHLVAMFLLGGSQGALGWFMVKSGLVDNPDVSHYRLTAHLGLALLIFCYILWGALSLVRSGRMISGRGGGIAAALAVVVFAQILSGGLVAGLNAGLVYNTWPLMDGQFVPDGLLIANPWWINSFENVMTVQFQHRMGAYTVATLAIVTALLLKGKAATGLRHALLTVVAVQIGLGIATLLHHVPVALGTLHQGGAVLVLTTAVALWHDRAMKAAA